MAQARQPVFYLDYRVPDTPEGRFELIALHLGLVLRRLQGQGDGLREIGQKLFDRFCGDMEANLRELGVGDLAIPSRVRRMAEAYFGRAEACERALSGGDTALLADALVRNVFSGDAARRPQADRLARYVLALDARFAATVADAFAGANLDFLDPAAVS
ncbi:MAG: ubiquinol-cytochrome C chaperone [Proteobacteria bacterium]|nr:ubiquinol-cytochrome C chaperone [Pseudomonadota bacterium]